MPCLRLGLLFDLTPGPRASCVFLSGRIESLMACCEPDNVPPPTAGLPSGARALAPSTCICTNTHQGSALSYRSQWCVGHADELSQSVLPAVRALRAV